VRLITYDEGSDWIPDLFTMEIYNCTHYNYWQLMQQFTTKYKLKDLTWLITATLANHWLLTARALFEDWSLLLPDTNWRRLTHTLIPETNWWWLTHALA
jgi:hypothetical protein